MTNEDRMDLLLNKNVTKEFLAWEENPFQKLGETCKTHRDCADCPWYGPCRAIKHEFDMRPWSWVNILNGDTTAKESESKKLNSSYFLNNSSQVKVALRAVLLRLDKITFILEDHCKSHLSCISCPFKNCRSVFKLEGNVEDTEFASVKEIRSNVRQFKEYFTQDNVDLINEYHRDPVKFRNWLIQVSEYAKIIFSVLETYCAHFEDCTFCSFRRVDTGESTESTFCRFREELDIPFNLLASTLDSSLVCIRTAYESLPNEEALNNDSKGNV